MARTSKRAVGSKTNKTDTAEPAAVAAPATPDMHAILANERALQGWVHSSILLQAAGFALTQLGDSALRGPVGVLLIAFGALTAALGYRRFQETDQALRRTALPAPNQAPFVQATGLVVIAVLMGGLQIAGIW